VERAAERRNLKRNLLIAAALSLFASSAAFAQPDPNGGPDPSTVKVRLGPLWLNPMIELTNLGIDTNVFNEAPQQNPKRDFTLTVVPKTQLWIRMGPSWISGEIIEQVVWYQQYSSERSSNNTYSIGWKIPLNRVIFDVGARYVSSRERPGFEIDERAQHFDTSYRGKVEVRALSKTFFGVEATRETVEFDSTAVFSGINLQEELGRVVTTAGATVRQQLTPLTAITLEASTEEARFTQSPLRDSDSRMISAAVAFDPLALIKGRARVGVRDFQPRQPGVPRYDGVTAAVDLSYVLLNMTKFTVGATRDVQYSYDINEPYYLQTGVSGSVTQQIFGPLDAVGRAGIQHLDYRDRAGAGLAARVDEVQTYGGGIGYHVGPDLRIGVNIDHARRTSPIAIRQYDGLVFGTSITYGF
jgi:hypothetical protein